LVHCHTALDVNDGAVEGSTHILKVTEDEGLVHIKATSNDVLAVLQQQDSTHTTAGQHRLG
jgi:tyrosine-protein phosphatase YwqE